MGTHKKKHVGPFLIEFRMCGQNFVTGSMDNKALVEIHDHVCSMILSASQEVSCLFLQNLGPKVLTSGTLLFDLRNGSPES